MRYARCKSCGARIIWARTAAGKPIPLDAKPVAGGNLVFNPFTGLVAAERGAGFRHVSHFSTCTKAAEHRKPKARQLPLFGGGGGR